MIDFPAARDFLSQRMRTENVDGVVFKVLHKDASSKPVTVVRAEGSQVSGQFSLWITGEVDYEIYKGASVVSYEWGLLLTDDTLPSTVEKFISELTRLK